MYLPPYSLDLMPVERLWSWLRRPLGICTATPKRPSLRIASPPSLQTYPMSP